MALTDTAIKNTKLQAKSIKLADEKGLYLLLNSNGSKWWRLDYRFGGKRKTLSMGFIPLMKERQGRHRAYLWEPLTFFLPNNRETYSHC